MDLRRPFRLVAPTLDGDVLAVLAGADGAYTGREIQRRIGASSGGTQDAIDRLVEQGIATKERAGRAYLYRLNREHMAARAIEEIASLPHRLMKRLQEQIAGWDTQPELAAVFGSVARGEADEASDLDVFLLRPASVGVDDETWRRQLSALEDRASAWTGNVSRVLEYGVEELPERADEPVLADVVRDGIALAGSLAVLRRAIRSAR